MSNYNLSSMDPMGPFQGISHGSSRVWKPAILNLDEMEYLKYYTLAEKKIIFFGGKVGSPFATYQSLSDLDDYFDPRSHDSYNKNIQFGHLADYFMGGFGAGDVFHFSALDAVESLDEDQNNTYITGRAHTVSQQALIQRAAELVADPLFMSPIDAVGKTLPSSFHYWSTLCTNHQKPDTKKVINHDFVVPIAEEVPFETYLSYLFSRVRRSIGAAAATIEAVYPSIKAQGRIILIIGPLTLLAVNGHEGWTDPGLLAEYRLLTGEFFSRVCHASARSIVSKYLFKLTVRGVLVQVNRNNNISLHIITGDPTISIQAVPTRAWRDGLNQLATHGYSRDMNRIIGCRIARAVAWGDRRLTGREADAIYSQVLVRLQRMRQGFTLKTRIESLQTIISRAQFLKRILHHAENRGPDTPGGGRRNGITEVQSTADIPSVSTSSQPQPLLIPKLKHMFPGLQRLSDIPLRGQVALVLHSGRRDGVTEACCLELAQLGATVAFTYTQGEVRSKEMANNILGKIMEAKGAAAIATAIDIPAVPYRYEIYTERPHEDVKFIDGAVKYVLGYFQINKFDIIGMFCCSSGCHTGRIKTDH